MGKSSHPRSEYVPMATAKQLMIRPRHVRRGPHRARRIAAAFTAPASGQAAALSFPIAFHEPESSKRTLVTGSFAALLHFGVVATLVFLASLAPVIDEVLIPVQLLHDEPPAPEEPAPAPKALAERRSFDFAPARAVMPQIVNPNVFADASPAVNAEALEMESVASVVAPKQIQRSHTIVEHVSAVQSGAATRATAVDIASVGVPAVRGPVKVVAPIGPSVGPRAVAVASTGATMGSATLDIGSGSAVREGVVSTRDVRGSSTGALLVSVDTEVGDGFRGGTGGTGTGTGGGGGTDTGRCNDRPAVQAYMAQIRSRTLERWKLPPGVPVDERVTLRFKLDVAGSASAVYVVKASDNALGASAVDAMHAASPFPPIPEAARCLSQRRIRATFSSESVAG
jgi:TonB family protein